MSAIHVLRSTLTDIEVVIHYPIPGGVNVAGVTWKNILIAVGLNRTGMIEGAGPGQISVAEKASILAGDVVEVTAQIPREIEDLPLAERNAALDMHITRAVSDNNIRLQKTYRLYGLTRG